MFGSMWWWCSGSYTSSSDALDLFHSIQSLDNLKTLEVRMMSRSIDIFIAAFRKRSDKDDSVFLLERVEKLVVTSSGAFLLNQCPNLKRLEIQDESGCLLETCTDLTIRMKSLHPRLSLSTFHDPQLTHFDSAAMWSADELCALISNFPHLRSLRMRTDTYCYRASTLTIIGILGTGLSSLEILHLVKSGCLGMGYQSVWRRNIQKWANVEYRRTLWLENEQIRVKAENNVVRCAFTSIPTLQECWLGEKRVARKCSRSIDGQIPDKVQWMWDRNTDDVDDHAVGSHMLKFRMEKNSVVVRKELGF
ncbi:hypothetical protein GQ44DRAFT_697962 [Phaeosphaeriaceae sp. PMI808]|nr:hypothetical protein GQ44DRAFT_697962 [Phaeosphaeriaceae sp. PMI808]